MYFLNVRYYIFTLCFITVSLWAQADTSHQIEQQLILKTSISVMPLGDNIGSDKYVKSFGNPMGYNALLTYEVVHKQRWRYGISFGLHYTKDKIDTGGKKRLMNGTYAKLYLWHHYPMFLTSLSAEYQFLQTKYISLGAGIEFSYANIWVSKIRYGHGHGYGYSTFNNMRGDGYFGSGALKLRHSISNSVSVVGAGQIAFMSTAVLKENDDLYSETSAVRFPAVGIYWAFGIEILLSKHQGLPFHNGDSQ